MRVSLALGCVSMVALGFAARPAAAQTPPRSTLTVSAVQERTWMPETVRMSVWMEEKGKDLKAVLAALRKRAAQAEKSLAALGAQKGAVTVDQPIPRRLTPAAKRQISMALQRLKGQLAKVKLDDHAAALKITASFPVPPGEFDEQLLKLVDLEKKVQEILAPAKADGEDDDEETEQMNQLVSQMGGGGADIRPGNVEVVYVHKIDPKEEAEAQAAAFANARKSAEQLAQASNQVLGALVTMQSTRSGTDADEFESSRAAQLRRALMRVSAASGQQGRTPEVTSERFQKMEQLFWVGASFEIQPKK